MKLGLDFRSLEDRIALDVALYHSNSIDMIIRVPVSVATGYSQLAANAGDIEKGGMKFPVVSRPSLPVIFRWDITSNFTRNRNEVKDILDGVDAVLLVWRWPP